MEKNEPREQVEKRKNVTASNSGGSGGDSSLNSSTGLLPSKRARTDFSPSKSPVMSPLFEEESPTKLFPPTKDKMEANIDLAHVPLLEEDDAEETNKGNNKSTTTTTTTGRKAEERKDNSKLPSPLNVTDESEPGGKDKDGVKDNDAEGDTDSNKFFATIKAREEAAATTNTSPKRVNVVGKDQGGRPEFLPPSATIRRPEPPYYAPGDNGEINIVNAKPSTTGASHSLPIDSEYMASSASNALDVDLKVYCPRTGKILYDNKGSRLRTDYAVVISFLKHLGVDSQMDSLALSGYSGDISSSSMGSSTTDSLSLEIARRRQISIGSTISTIPRPSDASTVSRPSFASAQDVSVKPTVESRQGIHGGKMAPLLNSTRIEEEQQTQALDHNLHERTTKSHEQNALDINSNTSPGRTVADKIVPNGETTEDSSTSNEQPKQQPSTPSATKRSAAAKTNISTPQNKSAAGDVLSSLTSSTADTDFDIGYNSASKQHSKVQTPKGKWRANTLANTSPGTPNSSSTQSSSASTSTSSKRKKAEQSSESSQVLTEAAKKAIEEFNDESFIPSQTLWGNIGRDEIVFARWRDKSYYSGVIMDKGANDTWKIKYDDNMDDVASETHILPLKILGRGIRGVYCPPDVYQPEEVCIVGTRQNPGIDAKTIGVKSTDSHALLQYAAVTMDGRIIYCYRNNLTIKENDAKELRKDFCMPNTVKIGQIGVENIVAETTRRRRGVESLAPSDKIRKIIKLEQSGFDTSSSDDLLREIANVGTPTGTPTPKKVTGRNILKSVDRSKSNTPRRGSNASGTSSGDSNPPPKLEEIGSATKFTTSSSSNVPVPSTSKASVASTSTPKFSTAGTSTATPKSATPSVATPKETPKSASKAAPTTTPKPKKKEKKLFSGLQFFMTASGGAAADPSGMGPVVVPYDKDECRDLIENGGGHIIDVVGNESKAFGYKQKTYLISDGFARTVKYIYCVASAIPCVSYKWIVECTQKNSIVNWEPYQLKSGWSLEDNRVISPHCCTPLNSIKIFITAETTDLFNYWKPVLTAARATLLKPQKHTLIPSQTEVLVTDATCPSNVIALAKHMKIPIVKPEWLVQTIICGRTLKYDGHEKYQLEPTDDDDDDDDDDEDDQS